VNPDRQRLQAFISKLIGNENYFLGTYFERWKLSECTIYCAVCTFFCASSLSNRASPAFALGASDDGLARRGGLGYEQVTIGMMKYWFYIDILPLFRNVFKLKPSADFSTGQFDTIVLNLVEKIYFLC